MTQFQKISNRQFDKDFWGLKAEYEDIIISCRATTGSAGYDFFSPIDFTLRPGETIKIPTGIRVILPKDKFLMVVPRSSLGFKFRLQLDNTVGVIDSDYSNSDNEGHIWIKITNDKKRTYKAGEFGVVYPDNPAAQTLHIEKGQAIAQGIIMRYFTTGDDETNGVRNGGFGSTNNFKDKIALKKFYKEAEQVIELPAKKLSAFDITATEPNMEEK